VLARVGQALRELHTSLQTTRGRWQLLEVHSIILGVLALLAQFQRDRFSLCSGFGFKFVADIIQ
jgi:hypothetical protein